MRSCERSAPPRWIWCGWGMPAPWFSLGVAEIDKLETMRRQLPAHRGTRWEALVGESRAGAEAEQGR